MNFILWAGHIFIGLIIFRERDVIPFFEGLTYQIKVMFFLKQTEILNFSQKKRHDFEESYTSFFYYRPVLPNFQEHHFFKIQVT